MLCQTFLFLCGGVLGDDERALPSKRTKHSFLPFVAVHTHAHTHRAHRLGRGGCLRGRGGDDDDARESDFLELRRRRWCEGSCVRLWGRKKMQTPSKPFPPNFTSSQASTNELTDLLFRLLARRTQKRMGCEERERKKEKLDCRWNEETKKKRQRQRGDSRKLLAWLVGW